MSQKSYRCSPIFSIVFFVSYDYIGHSTDLLTEASILADHAGRSDMDISDVRLAIQHQSSYEFVPPPSREVLRQPTIS